MTSNQQLRNMTFNQTFQSSLVERNNQKFALDKSLYKGIKENDASKIIDSNKVSEGTQNLQQYNELSQIESIVLNTRKKYDEVRTQTKICEQEIQKLKNHKQILLGDEAKFNEIISTHQKQLQQTTKRLEDVSNLTEATIYRKDIYSSIKDNVKHDLLVLKKRYFDKDVRLMRDNTKLRTIRNEHDSKVKLSQRCREVLQSVEKVVHSKQLERTSKIQSFYDILNRKQATQLSRQTRQKQIKQAMMSAMTDKLDQQKQWIKMFNANLFLKGVLKAKMQRLMNKFNKIQLSFHKMKQATSVKNSNDFIQRFLNREQTYGILLESIAEKQKMLESLKQEREKLQKTHTNYLYKGQQIGQQKRIQQPKKGSKEGYELQNPAHIIHSLNQELLAITRQKQLIYQWGIKFLTAYTGTSSSTTNLSSTKQQLLKKYPKSKQKQLFLEVMKTVSSFMSQLEAEQKQKKQRKIEQAFLKNNPRDNLMSQQLQEKNTRIKTLSTYQNEMSQGEGYFGDAFDDKDVAYDDLSERDYLQYNRRAVKKSEMQNRKFRIKTKPNQK